MRLRWPEIHHCILCGVCIGRDRRVSHIHHRWTEAGKNEGDVELTACI